MTRMAPSVGALTSTMNMKDKSMCFRDPCYLNADFIDQLNWLHEKPTIERTDTVVRMINNRRETYPDTFSLSALFYGTTLLNWIYEETD